MKIVLILHRFNIYFFWKKTKLWQRGCILLSRVEIRFRDHKFLVLPVECSERDSFYNMIY